jgi:hypothetical protein
MIAELTSVSEKYMRGRGWMWIVIAIEKVRFYTGSICCIMQYNQNVQIPGSYSERLFSRGSAG